MLPMTTKKAKKQADSGPVVSVLMPVHNAARYLPKAMESILTQTYRRFELVVVDDASEDKSWQVVQEYKRRYPRLIKAMRLPRQVGAGGDVAANLAYTLARGEFIARMDADDVAKPERLAVQVAYLRAHPEVAVVGGCAQVIDKRGKRVGDKLVELTHEDIYEAFFSVHPMIHPTVMMRRSLLMGSQQLYRIRYDANNDYLTFIELISRGRKFANLPDTLVHYRIHGQNDSLLHIKQRFLNTVKIRWYAVRRFGYKPSGMGIVKLFIQSLMVLVLPERAIIPVYLWVRGIYTPAGVWAGLRRYVKRSSQWLQAQASIGGV